MYCYRKRNVLRLDLKRGLISFRERKGRSLHVDRGTEDGKCTGTDSGKSGTRNLEAESIRGRAKITARCVKLKTVKDSTSNPGIRSVYRCTCFASSLYSYLSSFCLCSSFHSLFSQSFLSIKARVRRTESRTSFVI